MKEEQSFSLKKQLKLVHAIERELTTPSIFYVCHSQKLVKHSTEIKNVIVYLGICFYGSRETRGVISQLTRLLTQRVLNQGSLFEVRCKATHA